ncbi:MAG: hypothetical protein ACREJT_09525, partial [Myxococcota bacterium]
MAFGGAPAYDGISIKLRTDVHEKNDAHLEETREAVCRNRGPGRFFMDDRCADAAARAVWQTAPDGLALAFAAIHGSGIHRSRLDDRDALAATVFEHGRD